MEYAQFTDSEAQQLLREHRRVWERKPVLRRIYNQEFFARILSFAREDGTSIEVGSGPGFLKRALPDVLSTDVVWCPWLDAVVDAHRLPFRNAGVTNIFGVDVLHHLAAPMTFLREAERILVAGGRLILIEPWVTPFSYLIYRYLHQEECDLSARPWDFTSTQMARCKKAFDGNQALPYLLFGPRYSLRTLESLPGFTALMIEPFCLFAYLLSMGFKRRSLLPEFMYPVVSKIETTTLPLWRPVAALRVLLVLEKSA